MAINHDRHMSKQHIEKKLTRLCLRLVIKKNLKLVLEFEKIK